MFEGVLQYKEPDDRRPANEDLYQLLAYCVSLGLTRGLLIYSGDLDRQYIVERAGISLEATGIDLTAETEQIELGACEAARRLVEHTGTASIRQNVYSTTSLHAVREAPSLVPVILLPL